MAWKEIATYIGTSGNLTGYFDVVGNTIENTPADEALTGNISANTPLDPSKFVADWGYTDGDGVGTGGSLNWGYHDTHKFFLQPVPFAVEGYVGCDDQGVFSHSIFNVVGNTALFFDCSTSMDDQGGGLPGPVNSQCSSFLRPVTRYVPSSSEVDKRSNSPWRLAEFNDEAEAANTNQTDDGSFCASYIGNGTPAFWGLINLNIAFGESGGIVENGTLLGTRFDGGHFLMSGTPGNLEGANGPEIGWRYYNENNWGPFIETSIDATANHQHEHKYLASTAPASQYERITTGHTHGTDGIEGDVFLGPSNFVEFFDDTAGNTWAVYSFFRTKNASGTTYDISDSSADTPDELKNIMHTTNGGASTVAAASDVNGLGFPGGARVKIWDTNAENALTAAYSLGGQYHSISEEIITELGNRSSNQHFDLVGSGDVDADTGLAETYTFSSGYIYPYFYDNETQDYLDGCPTTNATTVHYGHEQSLNGNQFCSTSAWNANVASFDGGTQDTGIQLAITGAGKNQWLVMGRYFLVMVANADSDHTDTLPNGIKEEHFNAEYWGGDDETSADKVLFKLSNLYRCKAENCASTLGGVFIDGDATMPIGPSLANIELDTGDNSIIYGQAVMTTVSDTLSGLGETANLAGGGQSSPCIEIDNNIQGGSNAKMWLESTDAMDDTFGVHFRGGVGGAHVYENAELYATTYHESGMVDGVLPADIDAELEDMRGRFNTVNTAAEFKTAMDADDATETWIPTSAKFDAYMDQTTKGVDVVTVKGDSINIGTVSAPSAGHITNDARIFVHIEQTDPNAP